MSLLLSISTSPLYVILRTDPELSSSSSFATSVIISNSFFIVFSLHSASSSDANCSGVILTSCFVEISPAAIFLNKPYQGKMTTPTFYSSLKN